MKCILVESVGQIIQGFGGQDSTPEQILADDKHLKFKVKKLITLCEKTQVYQSCLILLPKKNG